MAHFCVGCWLIADEMRAKLMTFDVERGDGFALTFAECAFCVCIEAIKYTKRIQNINNEQF